MGNFPSKDLPVGKPSRNKSVRRQDETKIQRYNKYNLTQRSYDVLYKDEMYPPDVMVSTEGVVPTFSYRGKS